MEKDAKLNDMIRLKQAPVAPVERWQMIPTSRCIPSSTKAPTIDRQHRHPTSPLKQIPTNIPAKTPEPNRIALKYKTPKRNGKNSPCKSPGRNKTPCRSRTPGLPSQQHKTPKSLTSKSPGRNGQTPSSCRFIPSRVTTDVEYSSFLLQQKEAGEKEGEVEDGSGGDDDDTGSPSREEYQRELLNALSRSRGQRQRGVLSFKAATPSASTSLLDYTKSVTEGASSVCNSHAKSAKRSGQHLSTTAEKILDAPTIMDDYYLNNLHWGKNNCVAIGLGQGVYLWNASDGSVKMLTEMKEGQYVSSVSWSNNGKFLAIGGSNACVQLWDVEREKTIRVMKGHADRVGVLAWNRHTVTSASRDGMILYNDVRKAEHVIGRSNYHKLEVCGLQWSADGSKLASGANDNLVCIWNPRDPTKPTQVLRGHQSAIKAVAWCPWQPNILATGGGKNDRTIRLWNSFSGECLDTINAKSSVSSLAWNMDHKQLISAHGDPKNQMVVWQYPSMMRLRELTGHSDRILHMCLSPRKSRVASAGSDETLRIWNCFERLRHDVSQRSYSEDSICAMLHSFT